jgi:hypothetical protein
VHRKRGVIGQHSQPIDLAPAERLRTNAARHSEHAERFAMRAEWRENDWTQCQLGDHSHEWTTGIAEVTLADDHLLGDRFLEERSIEVEAASQCREKLSCRRDDFTLSIDDAKHRRRTRRTLLRCDIAQRAEYLRHVGDFSEPPSSVMHRGVFVVWRGVRFEDQAIACGADAAAHVERSSVTPTDEIQVQYPRLTIGQRGAQFILHECDILAQQ